MNMQQTIILATAIVIGGFLLGGRYGYESIAVPGEELGFYSVNRLTGSARMCGVAICSPMNEKTNER